MTDPFGRWLLKQLEKRFDTLLKNRQLMRIIGKKYTIWVTKR